MTEYLFFAAAAVAVPAAILLSVLTDARNDFDRHTDEALFVIRHIR